MIRKAPRNKLRMIFLKSLRQTLTMSTDKQLPPPFSLQAFTPLQLPLPSILIYPTFFESKIKVEFV